MTAILSILLASIFALLGLVHFYWMFGYTWGLENALPKKENGEKTLNPGKLMTGSVGVGLWMFAAFYLFSYGLFPLQLPIWMVVVFSWAIPIIFMVRAIGDFKYVGFFKKIKNTTFGQWDSSLFSPLCLLISAMGFIVLVIAWE